MGRTGGRDLKKRVHAILQAEDFAEKLPGLTQFPARQAINPLFSFLLSKNELIKWRAVTAMGLVVARLADKDMESARVIMRRLMWSLNDESGGIGWGAPEAMGEIIACHEVLGREYAHVLISYVWEEGNYLEYDLLRQGAVWGIGRASQTKPHLMQEALPHVIPLLQASDAVFRGLAVWIVGLLGPETARLELESLLNDPAGISIYRGTELQYRSIKSLATEALAMKS